MIKAGKHSKWSSNKIKNKKETSCTVAVKVNRHYTRFISRLHIHGRSLLSSRCSDNEKENRYKNRHMVQGQRLYHFKLSSRAKPLQERSFFSHIRIYAILNLYNFCVYMIVTIYIVSVILVTRLYFYLLKTCPAMCNELDILYSTIWYISVQLCIIWINKLLFFFQ